MRKLKNVELVGETRLIPGVGHVVMADEMPEYVADACEKIGLDWFEAGASNGTPPAELSNQDSGLVTGELVTGELVTGDDGELVTGTSTPLSDQVNGAEAQNGRKRK
jgi:hypothetical protein